jgi:hypothetical protein
MVWIRTCPSFGVFKHGNEASESIKYGKFVANWATASLLRSTLPHEIKCLIYSMFTAAESNPILESMTEPTVMNDVFQFYSGSTDIWAVLML